MPVVTIVTLPALAPPGPRTSIRPVSFTLFAMRVTVRPWAATWPLMVRLRAPKSKVHVGPETVRVPSIVHVEAVQHAAFDVRVAASHADTEHTACATDGATAPAANASASTRNGRRGRWGTRTSRPTYSVGYIDGPSDRKSGET